MMNKKDLMKLRNEFIDLIRKWDEERVDYKNPDVMTYSIKYVETYAKVVLCNQIIGLNRFEFNKK